jgi:hypothetical protein
VPPFTDLLEIRGAVRSLSSQEMAADERIDALSAGRAGGAMSEPAGPRSPHWVVPLFGLAALLLVPWVVLLVVALPSAHQAAHWDIAWAGFDTALSLLLVTVAVAARRRSPWLEGAATATATLLFVDAWFDVLTSSTRTELVVSIGEAALIELPLAILCLLLARDAERRLRAPWVGRAQLELDVVSGSAEGGGHRGGRR